MKEKTTATTDKKTNEDKVDSKETSVKSLAAPLISPRPTKSSVKRQNKNKPAPTKKPRAKTPPPSKGVK